MEKSIIMVGQKSPLDSAFAVFEHFKDWGTLRKSKVLPENAYFLVVVLADKNKADIAPNLFVQGYRPHSSGSHVAVDCRRYGAFLPEEKAVLAKDDIQFLQTQLYQIKGEREVELILRDGECTQKEAIERLVNQICSERSYTLLNDVQKYMYNSLKSAGYFLGGRKYPVWGALIGENVDGQLVKKMLILDYYTGVPAVVVYVDSLFEVA